MPIGLYQDLALGASPDGSDAWAFPEPVRRSGVEHRRAARPLRRDGAELGTAADRSARARAPMAIAYWIELLRAALRHAGALRIDHVIGLFRQFWIPEGERGSDGAYVRFPTDDLLGILALESDARRRARRRRGPRHRAARRAARRWRGGASCRRKVLYFERDDDGGFPPRRALPARSRSRPRTRTTCRRSPASGAGATSSCAATLGAASTPRTSARTPAQARARATRRRCVRSLRDEGMLPRRRTPELDDRAARRRCTRFLRRTPACARRPVARRPRRRARAGERARRRARHVPELDAPALRIERSARRSRVTTARWQRSARASADGTP